uniref:Carnitine O-palmitoyltransferase 2, mitochondrial-like isoform X2 n=1 Tax=Pogona vitticeps TaxID=103695 RepID=A0ABM5FT95_9SAUR
MHRARPHWGAATLRSRGYWRTVGQPEGIVSEQDTDHHFVHRSTIPTMHFQPSLPRLPIPKLEDTIKRYLAAQKPLLNYEQYRYTKKIAREFEAGEGKLIHRDLLEHDKLNKHTSYISAPWSDMYLSAREPIVFNYNPFITLNPDPNPRYSNQIVRATNLVVSSLKFLNSLKNDYLRPDIYYVNRRWGQSKVFKHFIRMLPPTLSWYGAYLVNAYPLDMSQYKSLFNSTRIPNLSKDSLFTDEFARHLLVMRNGHFYVFEVLDPFGNILHPSEIQAHLTQIIHDADRLPGFELSLLTTEERNTWATLRQELVLKGQGFDRHLFALKYLVQRRGGRIPDIYNDPAYKNINHIIVSTSTLGSPAVHYGGFGPVVPDGFGVGYNVFDTWIGCIITNYSEEDLEELLKNLEYTLNDIFDILEGRKLQQC